ncbi:MAG: Plug domain-containing protein, partial [Arenibacter sp.]
LVGQVAFKAIGNDGLERNIKGQLVDSKGNFIATLATIDRGSGFFTLKPLVGEQYSVILSDGSIYPFPKVMNEGYAITVYNVNPKSIQVKIQATETLRERSFYVIGHINNKKYYQGKFDFEDQSVVNFEIPKSKLPSGIMTLTLFDAQKKPWCERIAFINNQDELVITAKINPKKFKDRSEITVDVHVTDTDGRPVSAELSMAATDIKQGLKNPNDTNIITHLLLQSDVKGHITEPGLLFRNQKKATLHALDLVMLTHGWRKIPWSENDAVTDSPQEFNFVKGLSISGNAMSLNNKPMGNTPMTIIAKSGEQLGMLSTRTALDGSFSIPDFNFKDSTNIAFNAFDSSDKPTDVKITLDKRQAILPPPRFKNSESKAESYIEMRYPQSKLDPALDLRNTTQLDEVIVTEKKIEKSRNASPSVYGQTPDATLYMEDHQSAQTVLDLVRRFSGVTVNGNTVSIRNGGTPLWILNGIPVNNDNPSASSLARASQRQGSSTDQGAASVVPTALSLSMEQSMAPSPVPTYIATMDT